jgi:hypothetical protein
MKTISLNLNDAELTALNSLLDLALRNAGMNALQIVSHFATLLSQAQSAQVPAEAAAPAAAVAAAPVPVPPASAAPARLHQKESAGNAPAQSVAATSARPPAN